MCSQSLWPRSSVLAALTNHFLPTALYKTRSYACIGTKPVEGDSLQHTVHLRELFTSICHKTNSYLFMPNLLPSADVAPEVISNSMDKYTNSAISISSDIIQSASASIKRAK